jgi:hypothetical protein
VPYASEGEGLHLPPVPEALNARATRTDLVRVFTIAQSLLAGLYKIPKSFSQSHDRFCKPVKQNQQFHTKVSDSAHSKSDTVKSASRLYTIHSTCSRQCTVQKPYAALERCDSRQYALGEFFSSLPRLCRRTGRKCNYRWARSSVREWLVVIKVFSKLKSFSKR